MGRKMWGPSEASSPSDASLNKYSLEYSHEELLHATHNFNSDLLLGSGSFGVVFRGVQRDGCEVAIKVLEVPEKAGFEEEVRVLSRFRHPNLVILMGFARHGTQRFLVYELLCGGDVYTRLWKSCTANVPFTWRQRASAAFDAACGLSHLHNSTPKAFHRDIKTANILLDRNGTAKMADFGLACLSHVAAQKVKVAAGTVGYACPHYAQRAIVTEGSEVYSFGVVILEILTALRPATVEQTLDGCQQYRFLVSLINGDARAAVAMADFKANWPSDVSQALSLLALRCIQQDELMRPRFTGIVKELRPLRDALEKCVSSAQNTYPEQDPPAEQISQQNVRQIMARFPAPGVQAAQQVPPAAPSYQPVPLQPGIDLWLLECISTCPCGLLCYLSREQRSFVHQEEPVRPISSIQHVGRFFQRDFFTAIARDQKEVCKQVSREHFQISAEEVSSPGSRFASSNGKAACFFFLTNCSTRGTIVNGTRVSPGEQMVLHDGDLIAIPRCTSDDDGKIPQHLFEFRFDLSHSILWDASRESAQPLTALHSRATCGGGSYSCRDAQLHKSEDAVTQLFRLEVSGPAVREDVAVELRQIIHWVPVAALRQFAMSPSSCVLLRLGRAHQPAFWRGLLHGDAYSRLSREHLQIESCSEGAGEAPSFCAKNLSPTCPVSICSPVSESVVVSLEDGERQLLCHGDAVVLELAEGLELQLVFWALSVGDCVAVDQACGGA